MYLSLPIPTKGLGKITLANCLEAFVKEEVMEKANAWYASLEISRVLVGSLHD